MNEKLLIDPGYLLHLIDLAYCSECDSYNGVRCRACEADNFKEMIGVTPAVSAVALPCKMGDLVWTIRRNNASGALYPYRGRVSEMYFTTDMQLRIVVFRACRGAWGTDIFATKEEAKEAIKIRKESVG